MEKTYYVIVDLYNLSYQKNGEIAKLYDADKFETLKEAKEELEKYNTDFNGAIYKVKEFTTIQLKKAE